MKRFCNMKLARYKDTLLQANDVLKIAQYMHDNVQDLDKLFDSVDSNVYGAQAGSMDSLFMYKTYRYLTGEKKTVHDYDEEGKKIEGTEREEDVRSSVDIFETGENAFHKRISTYNDMNNKPISVAFSLAVPTSYKYVNVITSKKDMQQATFKLPVFDDYSTAKNLNSEAWLFRSMSIDIQLFMSYLAKYKCPGIEIYFSDIPLLLEKFGLTPSTEADIVELQ